MASAHLPSRPAAALLGTATVLCLSLLPLGSAHAATFDGQIDLYTAGDFGVLGASAVTNTGPTVIDGDDLGVSPGTSITGFPPGLVVAPGATHRTDAVAAQAQVDLTTAYNEADSADPTSATRVGDLAGLSLTPGVYAGGELSLNGDLTLAGTAESVWLFQADSTLITGSGSRIILTDGASACNVYWQVGSSATLGTSSDFVGTIMAKASITATTRADVVGRLLAQTGAVTLDSNVITAPTGCEDDTEVVPPVVVPPVVPPVTPGLPPVAPEVPPVTPGAPPVAPGPVDVPAVVPAPADAATPGAQPARPVASAPRDRDRLAETGGVSAPLIAAAALLLGAGAVMLRVRRSRSTD